MLTAIYNIWLCLAELVPDPSALPLLPDRHQPPEERGHGLSGPHDQRRGRGLPADLDLLPPPHRHLPAGHDDIIWSNERFLHLTGDPDHLFETKLSALVPSFQSQWLLDGDHLSPEPVPVGDQLYLVFGNLVCTGGQDEFLATTYWVDVTEYARWRNNLTPPGLWWAFCRWTTMRT